MNMIRNEGDVWVPEAPEFPGLYANEDDHSGDGYIKMPVPVSPSTQSIYMAKQFATEAECQAWCDANPVPVFVPRGHRFFADPLKEGSVK